MRKRRKITDHFELHGFIVQAIVFKIKDEKVDDHIKDRSPCFDQYRKGFTAQFRYEQSHGQPHPETPEVPQLQGINICHLISGMEKINVSDIVYQIGYAVKEQVCVKHTSPFGKSKDTYGKQADYRYVQKKYDKLIHFAILYKFKITIFCGCYQINVLTRDEER